MSGSSPGMTSLQPQPLGGASGWTTSLNGGLRSLIRVRGLAVGASGPILSMLQPCFGQTSMESGQNVADLASNVRAALTRVTLDWVRRANGYHTEPETNRSAPRPDRARGRRARARLR